MLVEQSAEQHLVEVLVGIRCFPPLQPAAVVEADQMFPLTMSAQMEALAVAAEGKVVLLAVLAIRHLHLQAKEVMEALEMQQT